MSWLSSDRQELPSRAGARARAGMAEGAGEEGRWRTSYTVMAE